MFIERNTSWFLFAKEMRRLIVWTPTIKFYERSTFEPLHSSTCCPTSNSRSARTAKKHTELEILLIPYCVVTEMPRPPPKERQISDEFLSETCRRTACEFTLPLGGHWDNIQTTEGQAYRYSLSYYIYTYMYQPCTESSRMFGAYRPNVASCMTDYPTLHELRCDTKISCMLKTYKWGQSPTLINHLHQCMIRQECCPALFWSKWDVF